MLYLQVRQFHVKIGTRNSRDGSMAGIGEAIDRAIDEMSEDFEIKNYITANRAEVKDMCLTEYNETEAMEMLRQEGNLGLISLNDYKRHG